MPTKTKQVAVDATDVVDLDARRAARAESNPPRTVKFGGQQWLFKSEFPMQTVADFTAGDIAGAFSRLLVEAGDASAFLAAGDVTQTDFADLMRLVYGLELPN